jgi:hypothetical protein
MLVETWMRFQERVGRGGAMDLDGNDFCRNRGRKSH